MAKASERSGEASGKHQGMFRPDDERDTSDKLANVSLKDRGAVMEDHLRDKRGNGVANDYDDAIDEPTDRRGISRGD